jgi:uncharacterized membrane protein
MHYFPLEPLLLAAFGFFLLALAVLIPLGALRYVYAKLGLSPGAALLVLTGSLLGSYVNIPLFRLPEQQVETARTIRRFGMLYVMPEVVDWPGALIAINVGGAAIPIALSLWLAATRGLWLKGALATACVAFVCHQLAEPVRGAGIALPIFVPPLATAVVAFVVSRRDAAPLAYVAGSLGTLIGADILNLDKIQGLGAPIASIGGAGTFDGVFLTGVLAVIVAGLAGSPTVRRARV